MSATLVPVDRRFLLNAIHLGCSFCGVFMAFSVSQNFQTSSDHKTEGSTALGILYAFFTFSNFAAAYIVARFGAKWCLFFGSLTYVAFVGANIQFNMYVLYTFSALLGFGASVIWCAQGVYISNCAGQHERAAGLPLGSTLGFFNGIFFFIFQCNQVLGNLLAALLFQKDVSTSAIFIVMTTICGLGALTLTVLKPDVKGITPAPRTGTDNEAMGVVVEDTASPNSEGSALAPAVDKTSLAFLFNHIWASLKMLLRVRMMVLIPVMIFAGLSQTFFFGDFPPLIEDRATRFYVLAVLGGFDAASSFLMGKLSDKAGRMLVLCIGTVTGGASILFLQQWSVDQDATYVFFLVAMALGMSDAVFHTQIYSILQRWFEGETEPAFANFKLFQAGSTAVAFLLRTSLSFSSKCIMTGVSLLFGMAILIGYDLLYRARGLKGSVLDSNVKEVIDEDSPSSPMLSQSSSTNSQYGAGGVVAPVDSGAMAVAKNPVALGQRGYVPPSM